MVTSPRRLSISKETTSGPGAFPALSSDIAVMISSERGEDRSWSERVMSGDECGVTMGSSSMGMTSMSIWQLATSWKSSAQWFNLFPSLYRTLPSLATRLDEAGLENFSPKRRRSLIREPPLPCCSATRAWCPPSIAGLLSCNFGELPKVVVLSLKTSDVLWWCILQTNPSFFLYLDRLQTSLVIQSGSLLLGAGGRDLQAFWIDDLKLSH